MLEQQIREQKEKIKIKEDQLKEKRDQLKHVCSLLINLIYIRFKKIIKRK